MRCPYCLVPRSSLLLQFFCSVTSSELNVSPPSSSLHRHLPLNLRSFKSCRFSSFVSRPVSFAARVEMVLSSSASVSGLNVSACQASASCVIPLRGATSRFGSVLSPPWPSRRPLPPSHFGSSHFHPSCFVCTCRFWLCDCGLFLILLYCALGDCGVLCSILCFQDIWD